MMNWMYFDWNENLQKENTRYYNEIERLQEYFRFVYAWKQWMKQLAICLLLKEAEEVHYHLEKMNSAQYFLFSLVNDVQVERKRYYQNFLIGLN